MAGPRPEEVLAVKELRVSFQTYAGTVHAVRGASFAVRRGETLAIVGESGSGKTVLSKTVLQLLADNGSVDGGEIFFEGRNLLEVGRREMEDLRGTRIAMVFQDPMSSLDPTMRLGSQLTESLRRHKGMSRGAARGRAVELLELVGFPRASQAVKNYPHQFSGGMRQRAVIAIALACDPDVLLADEPTTALDVTIHAQILELLRDLQQRLDMSVVLVTHDLGVVAHAAHRVAVMYCGKVLEVGDVADIFHEPKHPYTWGLLQSVPVAQRPRTEELVPIAGSPPDAIHPPDGCPFVSRCPYVMEVCEDNMPGFTAFSDEHESACWLNHRLAPAVTAPDLVSTKRRAC